MGLKYSWRFLALVFIVVFANFHGLNYAEKGIEFEEKHIITFAQSN